MFADLKWILKCPKKAKIQIYQTTLRPVVVFVCGVWTLNVGNGSKLEVWERKILRRIYTGVNDGGVRRRRANDEIKN